MPFTPTSTGEGFPIQCEICGSDAVVDVSRPPGDSVCPVCGSFLWVPEGDQRRPEDEPVAIDHVVQLSASDRDEALQKLSACLARSQHWTAAQTAEFQAAILRRDHQGTVGIGNGFAVAHAKVHWIKTSIVIAGKFSDGIDFVSLDGEPVRTVFLIARPTSQPASRFLRALELISRKVRELGRLQ